MAHNLENYDGKYSFVENGRKERAWHGLGQVFDGPMTIYEALELSRANYKVELQPLVALTPQMSEHLATPGYDISKFQDEVIDSIISNKMVTMRMDTMQPLGVVSEAYGVVQNEDAFRFIDTLVTGQLNSRKDTPVIETAGVLGKGERVFVTAKFPEKIRLDNAGNDMVEMYMAFTTSHDGSGAVQCMVTPVRVVCNNTLNLAMKKCSGKLSLRHSANIHSRLDLASKENVEFAFKALNLFDVYKNSLEDSFNALRQTRLLEKQVNDIIAEVMMSPESAKVYKLTGNIEHEDITTRSRNLFYGAKQAVESGIGQEYGESGTGLWLVNGITTYFQNEVNFKTEEKKFDSIMEGATQAKLQKAYEMVMDC